MLSTRALLAPTLGLLVATACVNPTTESRHQALTAAGSSTPSTPLFSGEGAEELGALATCDLDGDGALDLLVGRPAVDQVEVVLDVEGAATPGATIEGPSGSALGSSLLCVPDLDGDGDDEALLGAPAGGPSGEGAVFLHPGAAAGLASTPTWTAIGGTTPTPGGDFGSSLALGDLTGDGLADLAVGAPHTPYLGNSDVGQVSVYAGVTGGFAPAPSWSVQGLGGGALFGTAVAIGALGGPGTADLVVGAPGTSGGALTGWADVGGIPTLWWYETGGPLDSGLGIALATLDIDGDGDDELAVGDTGPEPVRVYSGDGLGTVIWSADTSQTSNCDQFLHPTDLDSDGDLELISGCSAGVSAFDPGSGWPGPLTGIEVLPGVSLASSAAVVTTGDGASVILGAMSGTAIPSTVELTPLGATLRPVAVLPLSVNAVDVVAGHDLDEDGQDDLLVRATGVFTLHPGPVGLGAPPIPASAAYTGPFTLGDADADGYEEVLTVAGGVLTSISGWSSGAPSSASLASYLGYGYNADAPEWGQLDGDGLAEVVVGPEWTGIDPVLLFEADSSQPLGTIPPAALPSCVQASYVRASVAVTDLHGDGYDDVVQATASGFCVWAGSAGGPTTTTWVGLPSTNLTIGYVRLLPLPHRSGLPRQVLVRSGSTSSEVRLVDLAAGLTDLVVLNLPYGVTRARAGDVTGDGTDDLVLTRADGGITVFERLAHAPSLAPLYETPSGPLGGYVDASVGDPDADGTMNLVLARSGQVGVFELGVSFPNLAPTAAIVDTLSVVEGASVSHTDDGATSLLTNDLLPPGAVAVLVAPPPHGSVTIADDGTFTYTHDGSEGATDMFSYGVSIDGILRDTQLVPVTIAPVEEAPIDGGSPVLHVDEGDPVVVDYPGVSDPEGGPLTIEPDCDGDGVWEPAGTPCSFADDAVVTLRARATDSAGLSSEVERELEVQNVAPSLDAPPTPPSLLPGDFWSWTPTVSDPGADTFTFAVTSAPSLPLGVHASLGTVSLTLPADTTGYPALVRVEVTDDDGGVGERVFILPIERDDDGDGLGDRWEADQGLDPSRDDAGEDPDADGLTNAEEQASGTDPQSFDGPSAPVLISPYEDGAGWFLPGESEVELAFEEASDPQGDPLTYRIQLIEGDDATATLLDVGGVSGPGPVHTYSVTDLLVRPGLYSWRVRAADPRVAGPWTAWGQFVVADDQVEGSPRPLSPGFTRVSRRDATFTFSELDWAVSYEVDVERATGSTWGRRVAGVGLGDGTGQAVLTDYLPSVADLRWRVRGVTPLIEGEWSDWRVFRSGGQQEGAAPEVLEPRPGEVVEQDFLLRVDSTDTVYSVSAFVFGDDGVDSVGTWTFGYDDGEASRLMEEFPLGERVLLVVGYSSNYAPYGPPTLFWVDVDPRPSLGPGRGGCTLVGADPLSAWLLGPWLVVWRRRRRRPTPPAGAARRSAPPRRGCPGD